MAGRSGLQSGGAGPIRAVAPFHEPLPSSELPRQRPEPNQLGHNDAVAGKQAVNSGDACRLPLLIGLFGFAALSAVILNKVMSLVVVASALMFRTKVVPAEEVIAHWPIIVNLLAGSLLGAWIGADWATRMRSQTLYRVLAVLLVVIAIVLLVGHDRATAAPLLSGNAPMIAGAVAGFGIGVVASLMGVAGGELLIPTLVLLFGVDIKLAGSLSLAISLPTMIVGFARYSRDQAFLVLQHNKTFVLAMAVGSILGALPGGQLLGIVPTASRSRPPASGLLLEHPDDERQQCADHGRAADVPRLAQRGKAADRPADVAADCAAHETDEQIHHACIH